MKIAIVEDEDFQVQTFKGYIARFIDETHESVIADVFSNGMDFISDYKGGYDLILMDIAMPHMNGLEAARRLRKTDANVCLIFITTLAQYAIKGYEVNAFDFLVKPVEYELFKIKLSKAVAHIGSTVKATFTVTNVNGMRKIPFSEISYVESVQHYLYFHTAKEVHKMRASLGDVKPLFKQNGFAEINRSFLVNLSYVDGYNNAEVEVAGEKLPLSRIYKTQFLNELTAYLGGKI